MIVINKFIPAKGFIAMAIFPFIFVRKDLAHKFTDVSKNHELIHFQQQKELFVIGFYILYIVEFIVRIIGFWVKGKLANTDTAYRNISFEKEAYSNQENMEYLTTRKRFNFKNYL